MTLTILPSTIAIIFAGALATATVAQTDTERTGTEQTGTEKPSDRMVADLAACLDVAVDHDRLACTDAAARRLVDAVRHRDVVVLERRQITRTQRSLFGLPVDAGILLASRDAPAERVEALDTVVVSAARATNDRWILTLAEGGRWQTTEPWGGDADPHPDMAVSVNRAALGSYVLRSKGMRSVKVRRTP